MVEECAGYWACVFCLILQAFTYFFFFTFYKKLLLDLKEIVAAFGQLWLSVMAAVSGKGNPSLLRSESNTSLRVLG